MPDRKLQFMIVAGEASGDLHSAKLVNALRELAGRESRFFGAVGPLMREAGVEPIVRSDELSIVGLLEISRALPMFWRAFRRLKAAARERKPDVAILVDFPDFNLKLAKSLKRQGLKVVYYISPQLWAWRGYRVRAVRRYVDLMITILPFEKDWYAGRGVHQVEYVGSPLATEVRSGISRDDLCRKHGLDPARPITALLPGSRLKEIAKILPVMLEAAQRVLEIKPEVQFVIASANESSSRVIRSIAGEDRKVIMGETYDVLSACDCAAVTSGTATLEAAILGAPLAIVYKTSALNYALLRPLISVEHFGLVNLIAGERVAKELIQRDFTGEALADELLRLLDKDVNTRVRKELNATANKLGRGGASKRAAEAIMKLLET